MREIQLTRGQIALVDDEDYEVLSQYKWFALKGKITYYAARNITVSPGKQTLLLMHVEIMKLHKLHKEGLDVDHADHNGLNNTKGNLDCMSHRKNLENNSKNTSGYPGVCWHKKRRKWYSMATINGRKKFLGSFDTPQEAHKARQLFLSERGVA